MDTMAKYGCAERDARCEAYLVKGHANQQHVNDRITTQAHLEGNNRADAVADKSELCNDALTRGLCDAVAHRRNQYRDLVGRIHAQYLRIYKLSMKLSPTGQSNTCDMRSMRNIVCVHVLEAPAHDRPVEVLRLAETRTLQWWRASGSILHALHEYIAGQEWYHASNECGVTWLELLADFEMTTQCKVPCAWPAPPPPCPAPPPCTMFCVPFTLLS